MPEAMDPQTHPNGSKTTTIVTLQYRVNSLNLRSRGDGTPSYFSVYT